MTGLILGTVTPFEDVIGLPSLDSLNNAPKANEPILWERMSGRGGDRLAVARLCAGTGGIQLGLHRTGYDDLKSGSASATESARLTSDPKKLHFPR